MGSKFLDIHHLDPALLQSRLRGDIPNLVETLYAANPAPHSALRPAFELMEKGTFVFLPKGQSRADGGMYCRAVEFLLGHLGSRRRGIEFYPDESEIVLWQLSFGRCDATWMDLPFADTGVGILSWRSPETCRALKYSLRTQLSEKQFNPRYSPEASLRDVLEALEASETSQYGLFTVYQE